MKKMTGILMLTCMLVLFVACGGSQASKFVGTWNDEDGREIIEFFKDGSYVFDAGGAWQVNGDYKVVSDNKIEFTSNQSGLGQDMAHIAGIHEFQLDGDTLYFPSLGAAGEMTCYKE